MTVIVEAAARVFDERGYEAATTNHVAEVAGVSVGSVYQYFADKEALVTALHERHATHVLQVLDAARDEAPRCTLNQSLTRIVRGLLDLHRIHPRLQRLLHDEHASLQYRKAQSPVGREILTRTSEILALYPGLALQNPALTAELLVRTLEELVHAAALDPPANAKSDEMELAIVRAAEAFVT